jgi:hypothetical protein
MIPTRHLHLSPLPYRQYIFVQKIFSWSFMSDLLSSHQKRISGTRIVAHCVRVWYHHMITFEHVVQWFRTYYKLQLVQWHCIGLNLVHRWNSIDLIHLVQWHSIGLNLVHGWNSIDVVHLVRWNSIHYGSTSIW